MPGFPLNPLQPVYNSLEQAPRRYGLLTVEILLLTNTLFEELQTGVHSEASWLQMGVWLGAAFLHLYQSETVASGETRSIIGWCMPRANPVAAEQQPVWPDPQPSTGARPRGRRVRLFDI